MMSPIPTMATILDAAANMRRRFRTATSIPWRRIYRSDESLCMASIIPKRRISLYGDDFTGATNFSLASRLCIRSYDVPEKDSIAIKTTRGGFVKRPFRSHFVCPR